MTQFLVVQRPKRKYAAAYNTVVAVFEADSAAAAKRMALDVKDPGDSFSTHGDFKALEVVPLVVGEVYHL